jgi:hypothetical protein
LGILPSRAGNARLEAREIDFNRGFDNGMTLISPIVQAAEVFRLLPANLVSRDFPAGPCQRTGFFMCCASAARLFP